MNPPVNMADVLMAVQAITKVGVGELRGDSRLTHVNRARMLVYFVASQCFGLSTPLIAKGTGRDAGTIRNAIERLTAKTLFDPALVDRVEDAAINIAEARLAGRTFNPIYAPMEKQDA